MGKVKACLKEKTKRTVLKAEDPCSICMDFIKEGKVTQLLHNDKKTLCKHKFCKKCIKTWMKKNNTCPLCRKKAAFLDTGSSYIKIQPKKLERPTIELISELFFHLLFDSRARLNMLSSTDPHTQRLWDNVISPYADAWIHKYNTVTRHTMNCPPFQEDTSFRSFIAFKFLMDTQVLQLQNIRQRMVTST